MRFRSILVLLFCFACLRNSNAQLFRIGSIDLYGGNSPEQAMSIYRNLPVHRGDSIDPGQFDKTIIEKRLLALPGIKHISTNIVCCDTSGSLLLYIGICRSNDCSIKYRTSPSGKDRLPDSLVRMADNFESASAAGVKKGEAGEDDSQGFALFNYAPARIYQLRFIDIAAQQFELLDQVLRFSSSASHRQAAATIIAYSAQKQQVANALLYAVNDPDETTRNNAVRALGILVAYGTQHPELLLHIPAEPFIDLVNSPVWTDRNKGAGVLMHLTETRDPSILRLIRSNAWPSIFEMARWADRGHAIFSFVILCRVLGVKEEEVMEKNFSPNWEHEFKKIISKGIYGVELKD